MALLIYNTLSGKKESLEKTSHELKLFVCGPTVYDYSHIGHGRTYVFFDLFAKYLRNSGFKLFYLQNITDVDDKIINRAKEEGKDPAELAGFFTKEHLDDMKSLGADAVNVYAPATKFIKEIVTQVNRLIEKGYAYKIEGDGWYYDVSKFEDYGKLSRRTAAQAEDGVSRIDETVGKKNKADFCLWKFSPSTGHSTLRVSDSMSSGQGKPGEPSWQTELGEGRPGWHIEDTAISEHYFGPQYDIHGGALDLKFPHHEAEIAEQEAASGKKPFVKLWMHSGFLTVRGEKMSKSLKNSITIRDLLRTHSAQSFRMMVFMHHYRSPIDYNDELIKTAEKNLLQIRLFIRKLELVERLGTKEFKDDAAEKTLEKDFHTAMEDDLNSPKALAAIFEYMSKIHPKLWELSPTYAKSVNKTIQNLLEPLGFSLESPEIPKKINDLVKELEEFRASKQFVQSDALRKKIEGLGYIVEDTSLGTIVAHVSLNSDAQK